MTTNNLPTVSVLYTGFPAANGSKVVLFCGSPDGVNWGPTIDTAQGSIAAPGIALFQSQFWLTTTSTNFPAYLQISSSPDGINWGTPTAIAPSPSFGSSLVVFQNKLWVAYADGSDNLYVGSSPDGASWTFNPANQAGPGSCLAVFNNQLWLSFMKNDGSGVLIICNSSDGITWSSNLVGGGQLTAAGSSLAAFNGSLYVAFVADNSGHEVLICSTADGANWSTTYAANQATDGPVSLTVFNNQLWLAFKKNDDSGNILLCSSPDGVNWSSEPPLCQTTNIWPCLFGVDISTANLRPAYMVTNVIYSPPGSALGTPSTVTYGTGSTAGSTISATNSFQAQVSVSAGVDTGEFTAQTQFTASSENTNSQSVTVTKSTSYSFSCWGSKQADGLDHTEDQFLLWLNPLMNIFADSFGNVQWVMNVAGDTMIIVTVNAGWLLNPETMPDNIQAQLSQAGLDQTDFANILSLNPFTNNGTVQPNRYQLLSQTFPYEQANMSQTFTLSNSTLTQQTTEIQMQYSVGFSVSGDAEATASVGSNFEWTNTNSTENDTESSQEASFTINPPSNAYSGSDELYVYWDNVYQTFMFSFEEL